MTAALPNWPRLMPVGLACRYVGWSESGFLDRVGETWPEPVRIGKKVLWDRKALDEAVDRLTTNGAKSNPFSKGLRNANKSETRQHH